MSGAMSGWPTPQNFEQYLVNNQRQLAELGRRTRLPKASQILGPGIAPWAVELPDWNDDKTLYNGLFYTAPGALNSPDVTKAWIGESLATADASGMQEVVEFDDSVARPQVWRRLFRVVGGSTRTFTSWEQVWPPPKDSTPVASAVNVNAVGTTVDLRGESGYLNLNLTTTGALSALDPLFVIPTGFLPVRTWLINPVRTSDSVAVRVHIRTDGVAEAQSAVASGVTLRGSTAFPLP